MWSDTVQQWLDHPSQICTLSVSLSVFGRALVCATRKAASVRATREAGFGARYARGGTHCVRYAQGSGEVSPLIMVFFTVWLATQRSHAPELADTMGTTAASARDRIVDLQVGTNITFRRLLVST